MGQDRDLTFNGVRLVGDIGLVYSSFTETLPEPKAVYVDVPGGSPVDVSEALGSIYYGNGIHVLTFLLYAETQEERLLKKARVIALLHGKRASYTLSWAGGTYTGRAVVAFEHRWDNVDVVTVTITHSPQWTDTSTHYVYMTATSKGATVATVYDYLQGAFSYTVDVKLAQHGTARLGTGSTVAIENDNTFVNVGTANANGSEKTPLYMTVSDWWVGSLTDGKIILNSTHFPDTIDGEVTTDSDWALSGTNLTCANYSKQRAYVRVTKKGF